MKKIPKEGQSKADRERRALYKAIKDKLSRMQNSLRILYLDNNRSETETDFIHSVVKGIYDIKEIFFDLVFDETPPGEVLKNNTGRLGTQILPVP